MDVDKKIWRLCQLLPNQLDPFTDNKLVPEFSKRNQAGPGTMEKKKKSSPELSFEPIWSLDFPLPKIIELVLRFSKDKLVLELSGVRIGFYKGTGIS